jgi:CRP/FNR family transcriptional regulator
MRATYDSESFGRFFDSRLCVNQLLKDLPPKTVEAFDHLRQTTSYPEGSIIFAEGQQPRGVYLLRQGRAKLVLDLSSKRERFVRIAEPGEVLGLSATIAEEPYEISVEALTPCRVDFISRKEFSRLLHAHPEVCFRVVQLLGQNLHGSYEHVRLFNKAPSAAAKLAQLLLKWCEEAEETSEGWRLKIPLTHESIARRIGTSRETVTRTFGEFKNQQIVSLEGSTLLICKRTELEKLTQLGLQNPLTHLTPL